MGDRGRYPVLTVRQPRASAIILGRMTPENRSWRTYYTGPLWVHSGKAIDWHSSADDAWRAVGAEPPPRGPGGVLTVRGRAREPWAAALPRGVILGQVRLTSCHGAWSEAAPCTSWASPRCFHFGLAAPVPLAYPLQADGSQRFWYLTPELEAQALGLLPYEEDLA